MKAIILISSIFYIIGLKVSNQIELVKKSNPADTLISTKIIPHQPAKSVKVLNDDENLNLTESLKDEEPIKEEDDHS